MHCKGYGTEEVIEFCVDYIDDLKPIGVPLSRHEGRLGGREHLEGKKYELMIIYHSIKHTTQFCNSLPWWLHTSSSTRTFYAIGI